MHPYIFTPEFRHRFWAKVSIQGPDECWPWLGAQISSNGRRDDEQSRYGYISVVRNKKVAYAHRVAYAYAYGDFDDRMLVCHTCDTPLCCNAAHLFLGTKGDNNRDRARKGRGRESRQWGEANVRSKVSSEQVEQIRALVAAGNTQQAVADMFGIKQAQVSRIVRGLSRPHG